MFKTKLSPRNKQKISIHTNNTDIVIPNNWYDFACMCKIRSGFEIVNFVPYSYQVNLIDVIEKNKTTIVAKTRQLGITETISNYFLWKALRLNGYLAVIFSKTQSDTSNVAKRLRRQIENLGTKTKSDSLTDIEFINGGRILFRNSTPNGSRGLESVSDILFDEASFIDDIGEIYKSAIPCTTVNGNKARIIILSTPNGQSGWYWDMLTSNNNFDLLDICERIKNKEIDGFQSFVDSVGIAKVFIHWSQHPKFSKIENYLESIQNQFGLSKDIVEQEYNLSFSNSQTLVFSPLLVYQCSQDYKFVRERLDGEYYFGLDTASIGTDYTVLTIMLWDGEKGKIVDSYRKNQESSQINIIEIVKLIEFYSPISIGIETNGIGQIYLEQLQTLSQANFSEIRVSQESKIGLIARLSLALEKEAVIIPKSSPYERELLSFQKDGKKYQAQNGKNDDCVMSLAFALYVSPFKPLQDSNYLSFV